MSTSRTHTSRALYRMISIAVQDWYIGYYVGCRTYMQRGLLIDKDLKLSILCGFARGWQSNHGPQVQRLLNVREECYKRGAGPTLVETEERPLHEIDFQLKTQHVFFCGCIASNINGEFGLGYFFG
jgi:hypothetical protein